MPSKSSGVWILIAEVRRCAAVSRALPTVAAAMSQS